MNHRTRIIVASAMTATLMTLTAEVATAAPAPTTLTAAEMEPTNLSADTSSSAMPSTLPVTQDQTNTTAVQPLSPSLGGSAPVAAVDGANPQADIDNALSQAGNEFMLAVTMGTMAGGVVGLVGGCVVGAVVGAIGGCIPGLGIGAAVGPIIGGLVVGVPVGIAALAQAYNTLHAAGDISAPVATQIG
ncbi:hypothetical protein ACWEO2_28140 [Nocardia sp. NPDC004278]